MKCTLSTEFGQVISDDDELVEGYRNVKVFDSEKDAVYYAYEHGLDINDDVYVSDVDAEHFYDIITREWEGYKSLTEYIENLAGEENDWDVTKIKDVDKLVEIKNKLSELGFVDEEIYDDYTIDDLIKLNS